MTPQVPLTLSTPLALWSFSLQRGEVDGLAHYKGESETSQNQNWNQPTARLRPHLPAVPRSGASCPPLSQPCAKWRKQQTNIISDIYRIFWREGGSGWKKSREGRKGQHGGEASVGAGLGAVEQEWLWQAVVRGRWRRHGLSSPVTSNYRLVSQTPMCVAMYFKIL